MRAAVIAGLASLCAAPVFAGQDGTALTSAGLTGTNWALDCKSPASATNYHLSYSLNASGTPVETLRTTTGADTVRELRNVQVISADWLLYTMIDTDGEAIGILTSRKGDRKRTWWSAGKDGKAYILDGKGLSGGGDPPWFEKCP